MQLQATQKRHEELLDMPIVGTGSFATVFEYDATTVLKATSCGVTQKLFDEALSNPTLWPQGLPQVKQSLGVVATDEEGVRYRGYLIERLFQAEEWETESRGARAVTHGQAIRQSGRKTSVTRGADVGLLQHVQRLAQSYQPDPDLAPVQAQVSFALEMASQVDEPLRSAFLYMADFMAKGRIAFDLTTPDNLRLDCFGNVKLCDPASYAGEQTAKAAQDLYVLCDIPEAVLGLNVMFKPMAVRARCPETAKRLKERLALLGLTASLVKKVKDVKSYMQRPQYSTPLFKYAGVVKHVQRDSYKKAMFESAPR